MELMGEFQAMGYEATGAVYAAMVTACVSNNCLDEALDFKKQL